MMTGQEIPLLKNHIIGRSSRGHSYYAPEAKAAVIRYAATSGVALTEVAREQGIALGLLRRWVREYGNQRADVAPAQSTATPFVPVSVAMPASPAIPEAVRITLPNGVLVQWPSFVQADWPTLLHTLSALPCSASMPA